jgi:hypothetical protein
VLGPILVLFHTAFKFNGLVSISFWSMVAVVASGVAGRFIYLRIPRTLEGRELSLNELHSMKENMRQTLEEKFQLNSSTQQLIMTVLESKKLPENSGQSTASLVRMIKSQMLEQGIKKTSINHVLSLIRTEISMSKKIENLQLMQKLFRYWHVAHLPFAIIMLIIMVIHVIVTITLGYRWIF